MLVLNPVLMGASMIAFGFIPIYFASLFVLFLFGTGASASNVVIQQNLQLLVPNDFRGRVMGIWSIVHTSLRPAGEMQFTGVAALFTAPISLIFSGAMVMAAALFYTAPSRHAHALKDLREQAEVERAR